MNRVVGTFEDITRKETFRLRFVGLSEDELVKLTTIIPLEHLTIRRPRGILVAILELTASTNIEQICVFLSDEHINPEKYSLWISVVSSSDHSGVSVPAFVLEMIRRTRGDWTFRL